MGVMLSIAHFLNGCDREMNSFFFLVENSVKLSLGHMALNGDLCSGDLQWGLYSGDSCHGHLH